MHRRHPKLHIPLPRIWLMTDERLGDRLLPAIRRLPRGRAGVVLRNYATPPGQRRVLYEQVRRIARRNRLMVLLSGSAQQAVRWRADGWHGRSVQHPSRPMVHSMAVHDRRELIVAIRNRTDLVFLSPVHATRSHPGARCLGRRNFGLLARSAPFPVIALGGMTAKRFYALRPLGAHGYAAIDAWL